MTPIDLIYIIIFGASMWGWGWFAHVAKCERDRKQEELRLAITSSISE